jgi:hypothetical protein
MKTQFICFQCNKEIIHESEITTGYGRDKNNNKICFSCCGENDKNMLLNLKPKEKIVLYLVKENNNYFVTNWPGTFKKEIHFFRKGKHNFASERIDIWFKLNGFNFHGKQFGNFTQICHIEKTK